MDGSLPPELIVALDDAGIAVPPGADALETLLAASRARGLMFRIEQMPRFRDLPVHGGPRYRAVVWHDSAAPEARLAESPHAIRGRGETGAIAMARALITSAALTAQREEHVLLGA